MSSPTTKRTRAELVASLALPPGQWTRLAASLRRGEVVTRIAIIVGSALLMWAVTGAWNPPFAFRTGYLPPRDIVARIEFPDVQRTEAVRIQRRRETPAVYIHDPRAIVELRKALQEQVFQLSRIERYEDVPAGLWQPFVSGEKENLLPNPRESFVQLRTALADDRELRQFEQAVVEALEPYERHGVLENLQHSPDEGSQVELWVQVVEQPGGRQRVEVRDLRTAEALTRIDARLLEAFRRAPIPPQYATTVSNLTFNWISHQGLPSTLTLNEPATQAERRRALAEVVPATFKPGDRLVEAGQPLDRDDVELLEREHRQILANMTPVQRVAHSLANFGMFIAVYVLCGLYIFFNEPRLLTDQRRLLTLVASVVLTVTFCWLAARDAWRAELIPLVLFGMTLAIAYQRELALLMAAAVSLIVALSLGQGLAELVILFATAAAAILLLGRVRSRTKLTYVGLAAGVVAVLTTIGVGTLVGQAFGAGQLAHAVPAGPGELGWSYLLTLASGALWFGGCALVAGLMMTALLPFIERVFDVQTDISLLELGDAAHPLLQELARRAPGTYNHSINVASIAEAAAGAIGANGLLVRVGAYFHDIGKMLKPSYFVENQGHAANRHQSLAPAMSTLVIIAHVKDGADLARQHHLPQSIMDFIEQHHGTTLVEYFYYRAAERSKDNPGSGEVDETTFRYPGPKPQTLESGVLMLADAVESASRALIDPAPSRIEGLVHDIAMKRLLDGQFDECGLTLHQLHVIQESLVKSLTAVYHGRVKYPEHQQTA